MIVPWNSADEDLGRLQQLIAERLAYAPRRVVTQLTFQDPWNRTGPARGDPKAARLGR